MIYAVGQEFSLFILSKSEKMSMARQEANIRQRTSDDSPAKAKVALFPGLFRNLTPAHYDDIIFL